MKECNCNCKTDKDGELVKAIQESPFALTPKVHYVDELPKLKLQLARKLWDWDKTNHHNIYNDMILFKSYVQLNRDSDLDNNETQLIFTIQEMGAYIDKVIKMRLDEYSDYDESYSNITSIKKMWYEAFASQLIEFIFEEKV